MGRSAPFMQAAQPHSGEILPQTCYLRYVLSPIEGVDGGGGEMGRSVPFTQAAQPHSGEILPQTCHPRFVLPLKRSHERRGGGEISAQLFNLLGSTLEKNILFKPVMLIMFTPSFLTRVLREPSSHGTNTFVIMQ